MNCCSVEGCEDAVRYKSAQLCMKHYQQRYYRRTRERQRAARRRHYLANMDAYKERARRAEAEAVARDAASVLRRKGEWAKKNPERRALKEQRRRARLRANDVREVTATDLATLLRRAGGCCAYCGKRAVLTIDHIIPIARGGRHAIGNLTPACGPCNSSKGARLLVEWRALRQNTNMKGAA